MSLELIPVTFEQAAQFVSGHHRHHRRPAGHKFSVGVIAGEQLVGVVMVGRPVARSYDDGRTLEVNRTCTTGYPNANSMLYGQRGVQRQRSVTGDSSRTRTPASRAHRCEQLAGK